MIDIENYSNYPINDQIPSNQSLKNKALAQMKARTDNYLSNRPSLSQYIKDAEERQRTNTAKQVALLESQKLLNKAASSKVAANAMKNIVEPGFDVAMLIEGGGLAKNAIKSGLKSMSKKIAVDEAASTITSKGTTRYFNKANKELPYTTSMRSMEEVKNYNQGLKKQFKTGSTETPSEALKPYLTDDKKLGINDIDWEEISKMYGPASLLRTNKIKEADKVLLDFRNRISTPEGEKRMKSLLGDRYEKVKNNIKNLELKEDPSDYAYYTSGVMTEPYIGLHPELDREMIKPIVRHEIEHAVQKGATTEVDDILSNLELKKTTNKVNWDERKLDKQINPQNLKYKLKDRQDATDYFDSDSSGREKGAFLGELQQYMVDKKLISHPYAVNEITPSKIRDVFIDNIGQDEYPLRIFNIMKPTDNNYKIIADGLNKMLIGGGAVFGANKLNSMKNNEK